MKTYLMMLLALVVLMAGPAQATDYTIRGGHPTTGLLGNDSLLLQRNSTGQYYFISGSDLIRSTLQSLTTSGENYLSAGGLVMTVNPVNVSGTNITGVLKAAAFPALTGDATTSAGSLAVTVTKTNGVSFAPSATTDTTIAGNITSGTLLAARFPAFTGDVTTASGAVATALATVNSNTGSFGSSTTIPNFTVNNKGLITAAGESALVVPASTLTGTTLASGVTTSSITTLGTSANLPGSPTTTTQSPGDNTTKIATTAYVQANSSSSTLTNTHIRVGNASNVATDVAVSGDATMANTGALTVTNIGHISTGTLGTANGGTGAVYLGNGITNAGSVLDTTNGLPDTRLTGGIIYASDRGLHVNYAGASSGVFFISSASAANFTGGWGTIFSTTSTGGATIHADSGTVCGQSTFSQPAGTTIYLTSDNNNFLCDLPNALPLVIGTLPGNMTYRKIITTTDANGQTITAGDGTIACQNMQYSGVITGWSLWANVSGSAVVDWWNGGANIPTVANTITASAKPTLSSNTKATSTTLTGWTTTVTKGDWICAHIDSATTVTRLTSQLFITVTN